MAWLDRFRRQPPSPAGGPEPPDGPGTPSSTEVRAVEVHRVPLPFGEELVTARGGGEPVLLDAIDAALLRGAWPHRPLAVHARALAERAGTDAEDAQARLDRLTERGLLEPAGQTRALLAARASEGGAPPPLGAIAVVTRDRPELLARAIEGHLAAARAHGRSIVVTIADDSTDADVVANNRALAAAHPAEVRYAGMGEKAAYLERLLARAPAVGREVLVFALGLGPRDVGGSSVGANHNVTLLDAAGSTFVSIDDDTTARIALVGAQAGLTITGAHDPTAFRFHADRARALAEAPWADVEPCALHDAALGKSVGELIEAQAGGDVELDTASAALIRRLQTRGGRVLVSSLGIAGDSGMGSPGYYLLLGEPSRGSLFSDYAAHRRTRAVLRAAPRLTVSAGTFLMAPSLGIDARDLVPPFFPHGRNQDGAYAVALRMLMPDAYFAHLPAAVEHQPAEDRRFAEDADRTAMGVGLLADVVMYALELAPLGSAHEGPARFELVGDHLVRLARLAPLELAELLAAERAGRVGQQLARLQAALDAPPDGAPDGWLADVERAIEHLRATIGDRARALPVGWARDLGLEGAARRAAGLLELHGRLLAAWPTVLAAARDLRAEGLRPSTTP